MAYEKPLPALTVWNRPFWEACKNHELKLQFCASCGHTWNPPGPVCPGCLSKEWEWKKLSGRGEVGSWVVFHQNYFKGFKDDIPYNVSVIELEEGPRIFTNIVGCKNEDIRDRMKVEVTFEDVTGEITLPKFKPA